MSSVQVLESTSATKRSGSSPTPPPSLTRAYDRRCLYRHGGTVFVGNPVESLDENARQNEPNDSRSAVRPKDRTRYTLFRFIINVYSAERILSNSFCVCEGAPFLPTWAVFAFNIYPGIINIINVSCATAECACVIEYALVYSEINVKECSGRARSTGANFRYREDGIELKTFRHEVKLIPTKVHSTGALRFDEHPLERL